MLFHLSDLSGTCNFLSNSIKCLATAAVASLLAQNSQPEYRHDDGDSCYFNVEGFSNVDQNRTVYRDYSSDHNNRVLFNRRVLYWGGVDQAGHSTYDHVDKTSLF